MFHQHECAQIKRVEKLVRKQVVNTETAERNTVESIAAQEVMQAEMARLWAEIDRRLFSPLVQVDHER